MIDEFIEMYESRMTQKEIMKKLGINYEEYRTLYKEYKKRKKESTEQQKDNRIYETKEEDRRDQEEEHADTEEEEENHNEEHEEEYHRENDSEEENQDNQNNYEEIENEELKDFFDDIGEFETLDKDNSEDLEEEEEEEEIEKFVGDAKDTILFFMCMWLFLLSLKYPGDFMMKLEFVNEFIDKRERQIKGMVDKIDRVLRKYAKIYKMLVEFGDWTFIMDIMVLTLTFQAELEEKLGDVQEQVEEKQEENPTPQGIESLQNNRITALIGGTG